MSGVRPMSSTPFALVDLAALVRNYRKVCEAVAPAEVACVVKADAYGLGVGPVSAALRNAGCRRFFVATVGEGIELRGLIGASAGVRIYVLDGPVAAGPDELIRHALVPVLNSPGQVRRWSSAGPAALHVDTGMNRLGLAAADVAAVASGGNLQVELLMTHLACADEPNHPLNAAQVARFSSVRDRFPGVLSSIGNSAGAFLSAPTRGDLVRAGIVLYGGNPFTGRASPAETVVSLRAPVVQVRRLGEAAPVGYGATFVAKAGATIATVAAGYADGYPRCLGNCGIAAVHGTRVPVVGRVSMDLLTIDVSGVENSPVEEGDEVELFGREVGIDELATAAGTISYELLTGLGRRVERRYVGATDGHDGR